MSNIRLAIAGNPNVGKSSLFNLLTGLNQHVGNYPGVTVECKTGFLEHFYNSSQNSYRIEVADLPGIYSMNAFSPEEFVTRDFIISEQPEVVVNIADASNLDKNLYLTLQLIEMSAPLILFLNMIDTAEKNGFQIDLNKLSELLNIPVVSGSAKKKEGIEKLLDCAVSYKKSDNKKILYSENFTKFVHEIVDILKNLGEIYPEFWFAIKLLEGDKWCEEKIKHKTQIEVDCVKKEIEKLFGATASAVVVKERYQYIREVIAASVVKSELAKESFTRKIDAVALDSFFGIPIFFILMYLLFQIVFTIGAPMTTVLEHFFELLGQFFGSFFPEKSILKSLLVDGIIGGVGGVLVFTPNIFLMFFGIAFLEDSGYMARVAVIMDRYMSRIGLSGKSFVPMILGFGCSVPAIMGARIIENRVERLTTIFITPFMSCGARLPVYLLLISAFIPASFQAAALWLIYLVGVLAALVVAKIARKTILSGEKSSLFIELPRYSMPTIRSLLMLSWERGKHFLEKAGTIIAAVSILLWFLVTFPQPFVNNGENSHKAAIESSYMGMIGHTLEPAVKLMGGDWKVASSFVAALAAKEVFVSEMAILNSIDEGETSEKELSKKMKEQYSFPAALAFIIFTLLSAPCVATFAMVKAETKSWRWPIFQYLFMTVFAYFIAVLIYQAGTYFGG